MVCRTCTSDDSCLALCGVFSSFVWWVKWGALVLDRLLGDHFRMVCFNGWEVRCGKASNHALEQRTFRYEIVCRQQVGLVASRSSSFINHKSCCGFLPSFIYLFTPNAPLLQPCITVYRYPILLPIPYCALPVHHLLVPAHSTADSASQPYFKSPKTSYHDVFLQERQEERRV